jgi:hypothetical protein
MAGRNPSARGAGPAGPLAGAGEPKIEHPTPAAELKLTVGPASAGGTVPGDAAHHFITTAGIVGSVAAGIAGAVITLRISGGVLALHVSSGLTILALAELALGLIGAVLVAVCGRGADQAEPIRPAGRGSAAEPTDRGSTAELTGKDGRAGFPS